MSEGDSGTLARVADVKNHVKEVALLILGGVEAGLTQLLNNHREEALLQKFIEDEKTRTLIFSRSLVKHEGDTEVAQFHVDLQFIGVDTKLSKLVFIKRTARLADRDLPSQLRIMTFPGGAPFEVMQTMVSSVIGPFLKSAIASSKVGERSGASKGVNKSLQDLEIALAQMSQGTDFPEVSLEVPKDVRAMIAKFADRGKFPTVSDFNPNHDLLKKDVELMQRVQPSLGMWVREIKKVTSIHRDILPSSAVQEMSFWLNLEKALMHIKNVLASREVVLTLDLLRAMGSHAVRSFESDTGLEGALERCEGHVALLRELPIGALLGATDPKSLQQAVLDIFKHLTVKIKSTRYPIERALKLLYSLSIDFADRLLKALAPIRLLALPHDDFVTVHSNYESALSTWDEEEVKFRHLLRELARKTSDVYAVATPRLVSAAHYPIKDRIFQIASFRANHEKWIDVVERLLSVSDTSSNDSQGSRSSRANPYATILHSAYDIIRNCDPFDFSEVGETVWKEHFEGYEKKIETIENEIIIRLNEQLKAARTASEMFRIFSRYNVLFYRPKVKFATEGYQGQLLTRVKSDIVALQDKFKTQYRKTWNAVISHVRDIPPISGQIIWTRQLEQQLNLSLDRVEAVLGKGWESHVEGRALKEEGDSFRLKLDPTPLFDRWVGEVLQRQITIGGSLFDVEYHRVGSQTELFLIVNFHSSVITLAKETRNLKMLGFVVPIAIGKRAVQAANYYPLAVTLQTSLRTYTKMLRKIAQNEFVRPLVSAFHLEVQQCIAEGASMKWESFVLEAYVNSFSSTVSHFHDMVEGILGINAEIDRSIKTLETCPYTTEAFSELLDAIQRNVCTIVLRGYNNIEAWLQLLASKIEEKLSQRLYLALVAWIVGLVDYGPKDASWDAKDVGLSQVSLTADKLPEYEPIHHDILIRNQVMYLNPPIEATRRKLLASLEAQLGVVTELKQVKRDFESRSDINSLKSHLNFHNLLAVLPNEDLLRAYQLIGEKVGEVSQYVHSWLQYQAFWDMNTETVTAGLGDDMALWQQLLAEIKVSRAEIETSNAECSIGPVVISLSQVQTKISLKCDSIHRDIIGKFGAKFGGTLGMFYQQLNKARFQLEQYSIDTATTSQAINLISMLAEFKSQFVRWSRELDEFHSGQTILERQKFSFPDDWLHLERVDGEWEALNNIYQRRSNAIKGQVQALKVKVAEEDRSIDHRLAELIVDWDQRKPQGGDVSAEEASRLLAEFELKFTTLIQEQENMARAKVALEMEPKPEDGRLRAKLEELGDLKSSWDNLTQIWDRIAEIKRTPWNAVITKTIKASLDDLLGQMKNMPARVKSYSSYEFTQTTIKNYLRVNPTISGLKSDALKDSHWKQLMAKLDVSWNFLDLTLGMVWDADLILHEKDVQEIMNAAQGEKALEEFLKKIKEEWSDYRLEIAPYQNKTHLVKGWDDLFNQVKEQITQLSAMKASPYYKAFEGEANVWDDKLNKINTIFDLWLDVQRRWVYLEGVFVGSADIQTLLPTESQRFQTISTEFTGLMKKVFKNPNVLDVIAIPDVQRTLERLVDLLNKIQKALGEYLEKQRGAFPRFYFVGDEDLLDIIGNSKNIERIQKHFSKMFAAVNSIIVPEESPDHVNGVAAREGEEIIFKTPVNMKGLSVNDWLTQLENEIKVTLAWLLSEATPALTAFRSAEFDLDIYLDWMDSYQAQLVVLSAQVSWSEGVEDAINAIHDGADQDGLKNVLVSIEKTLTALADTVLRHQPQVRRKKLEQIITELVHQRDVTRELIKDKLSNPKDFRWLYLMRFYFDPNVKNVMEQLNVIVANAVFFYGFEYLGLGEKLVQTPLTDQCYLTMTQALDARQGGCPFGPAGTGKTESVKSLGSQIGRFVLVFNCDETFDFHAMGRIFVGLCHVGAWGCFDEFNRLEERMLSACSQQIQSIQLALKQTPKGSKERVTIEIVGKHVPVNPDMACFITMNPGYAGRSNLPDNLKKLFRNLAMAKPDRQLIAQVMLYSQGFRSAEMLAKKIVPLFVLCAEQLSAQSHYDFGLRALKAVLVSAGNVKRERAEMAREAVLARGEPLDEEKIAGSVDEQEVVIQSITQSFVPKLVADDIPLLRSLMQDVFPGVEYRPDPMTRLRAELERLAAEKHYIMSEDFMIKILQLYQVSYINHGLMLVGPPGSGKSVAWKLLLEALENIEKVEGVAHVMDPKSITKDELYGFMDNNTREWTDGLFTHTLRKIVDNLRGELSKRQWIIFDGDVDPEWVENLNSVLDDNRLLTLPNGERLAIPKNVRIMFEVQDLRFATLATVSRCGMIWFSETVLTLDMYFEGFLSRLNNVSLDEDQSQQKKKPGEPEEVTPMLQMQRDVAETLAPYLREDALVGKCLHYASSLDHIMLYSHQRVMNALFSMINNIPRVLLQYNNENPDVPLMADQIVSYAQKRLLFSLLWCTVGDVWRTVREDMTSFLRKEAKNTTKIQLPPEGTDDLFDYEVTITGEWSPWRNQVPVLDVGPDRVAAADIIVPTMDTVRHKEVMFTWLVEHLPVCLCGPPGSGKTMTLFSALRVLPEFEMVALNFSSATDPELLLRTFDQYCEYRKTPNGTVLCPTQHGKWIILFCDECNLPAADNYATVRVIMFLRQLVELNGFWRTSDHTWITLDRIQVVGACNPPTDPGRVPIAPRFLRHMPVVYVDYPSPASYKMIYGTFNRALLKLRPHLQDQATALTDAMVDFFIATQQRFTADMQPFYIYSPREMSRWVKGVKDAITQMGELTREGLVRLWAHEAQRLFQDRLVAEDEQKWTEEMIDLTAKKCFRDVDFVEALKRPILFSNWLSKEYSSVSSDELREYVDNKLRIFCEEELDVKLVLFDSVLDQVLRINRVYFQNQGHLLLIGISGAGKTTLARFVAWMNGLSFYQIKAHNAYTAVDFDEDLRKMLRRTGSKGEKIVMLLDDSGITDTAFLERMNTLLANGEVPGLFEGEEYTNLMNQVKEFAGKNGKVLDGNDELYKYFCNQVMTNLHVVFTMNPMESGANEKGATSPALFNRTVLDWFGDWSNQALFQAAFEFTEKIELDKPGYKAPSPFPKAVPETPDEPTYRQAFVNACVYVHKTVSAAARKLLKSVGVSTYVTPRHYLEFINQFVKIYGDKRGSIEEQHSTLVKGLKKIEETTKQVQDMQGTLADKKIELKAKEEEAGLKLQQMVKDQQAAEEKKLASVELSKELTKKKAVAEDRQKKVIDQLSRVQPLVDKAKDAVGQIQKKDLQEMKSLAKPPDAVRVVLEGVVMMLHDPKDPKKAATDWKSIKGVIGQPDFVDTVIHFDTEHMVTPHKLDEMKAFIHRESKHFNETAAEKASKAAPPLVIWVNAQLGFAEVLTKMEPLTRELNELQADLREANAKMDEVNSLIAELEKKIDQYKEEYAQLISAAQAIKTDLENVNNKVKRSVKLLDDLAGEKTRWAKTAEEFAAQTRTIVGDALLSAAFLGYSGYFDQTYRVGLWKKWTRHLAKVQIDFQHDLSLPTYLTNADERLRWKSHALPDDDLATENAILLKRSMRYPLVIDPSGQATNFILNEYADRKIKKTSFLDKGFKKTLESSLRFGTPLLVQDSEKFDSILNPVLNNEVRKQGGRFLISIGDSDVDLSPAFSVILTARNPSHQFPPDVCSRVTLINFTITRASLQTQCLNQALKCEKPDVDHKRNELMRLQGECAALLRQLERDLLAALNEAEGSILDDDKVIAKLEKIKKEVIEITQKVEETGGVMAEVEKERLQFMPLAIRCGAVYFTLEQMFNVHFLYRYSLQFFFDIFTHVLTNNDALADVTLQSERIEIIQQSLFKTTFNRVAPGMLQEHKMSLAMIFAKLQLQGTRHEIPADEFDFFLQGPSGGLETSDLAFLVPKVLTDEQSANGHALAHKLASFRTMVSDIRANESVFAEWLRRSRPEEDVPSIGSTQNGGEHDSRILKSFRQLLFLQVFRPDRVLAKCLEFIEQVLKKGFIDDAAAVDLGQVVEHQVTSLTPVLLCGVSGYDASTNVNDLVEMHGKECISIAIGSAEAFNEADHAINIAAKAGKWVLLKNVHLAPQWLVTLEKKLVAAQPHADFRIFLTSEIHPKLPVNLLRASRMFVFEPAEGVKASLIRTLRSFPEERIHAAPMERSRMYFLLAWTHAVLLERLRYAPIGWTKKYEFGEPDLRTAQDTIDLWIDQLAQGRPHVDPETIPWDALQTLMTLSIYGGRLDNETDQRLMRGFVSKIFQAKAFNEDYVLVPEDTETGAHARFMPPGHTKEAFLAWASDLPSVQSPTWIGLPTNAEMVLLTNQSKALIINMRKLQITEDEEDEKEDEQASQDTSSTPAWMRALQSNADQWLHLLPSEIEALERTPEKIRDPMFRFFEREINLGIMFLKKVRRDIKNAISICKGELKITNEFRELMNDLGKGQVVGAWKKFYKIPDGLSVNQWIMDLAARCKQLSDFSFSERTGKNLRHIKVWVGGLFIPEAFITATRQAVAQTHKWALEQLRLSIDFRSSETDLPSHLDDTSFLITNLRTQGGNCHGNKVGLSFMPFSTQPLSILRWYHADSHVHLENKVDLPVYLNSTRTMLIFRVDLQSDDASINQNTFYERGVCLVCSSLSGLDE